ncbi:hypothetical protein AUR66_09935 [Haloferax profundi]|uniref:DUF1059 domain-containing protein n=1 Tax=Haloferax profundi TaxID=1544718 RepID=A0A0W1SSR3_9EURY|nr:hypothetical protein AUR66_09935 [Haloferax profundi]
MVTQKCPHESSAATRGYNCEFSVASEDDERVAFVQKHAAETHDTNLASEGILRRPVTIRL